MSLKQGGPYLIIANHTAEFDIIFLNMLFDRPLYFVASDQLLNAGKGSWFLRTFFKPIPKSKSVADFTVIRRIRCW
jgi:1-acyl-sn-glycerol-3-phosphate acyltransferase